MTAPAARTELSAIPGQNDRNVRKGSLTIIFAILLAAICCAAADSSGKKGAARECARYYFMEGARRQAMAEVAASYEYYRKSYHADPSYVEAGSAYGSMRSPVNVSSVRILRPSLPMMRPFISSLGKDTTDTVVSATWSAAQR